jgi:hypothetical protein
MPVLRSYLKHGSHPQTSSLNNVLKCNGRRRG